MKKRRFCLILVNALLSLNAFSADKTIICNAPEGMRVDYFSSNAINLQNNSFIMGRDRVTGMAPKIILNDNNRDVAFILGDTSQVNSAQVKEGKMNVLAYNDQQISFTGIVSGAPILATYYPNTKILIYSQQSIWPGPNYAGARAVMFYAKCGG